MLKDAIFSVPIHLGPFPEGACERGGPAAKCEYPTAGWHGDHQQRGGCSDGEERKSSRRSGMMRRSRRAKGGFTFVWSCVRSFVRFRPTKKRSPRASYPRNTACKATRRAKQHGVQSDTACKATRRAKQYGVQSNTACKATYADNARSPTQVVPPRQGLAPLNLDLQYGRKKPKKKYQKKNRSTQEKTKHTIRIGRQRG